MSEAARAALEAYRRFFTAFNAQDSTDWTAARHLPHVRVSPRTPTVVIEYEGAHGTSTWDDLRATGWNHSIALEPILLHESASKVHIVGGWTRHKADGSPLLRNHATYIATRSNGTGGGPWAIQGQFGIDAGPPGLTDAHTRTRQRNWSRNISHAGMTATSPAARNLPTIHWSVSKLVTYAVGQTRLLLRKHSSKATGTSLRRARCVWFRPVRRPLMLPWTSYWTAAIAAS